MKKLLIALMIATLCLAGCGSSQKSEDEDNQARKAAETNTSLGRQYMDRGDYEIALDKLKRAIAHDPTYAPAHSLLGVLYETIGEDDLAGEQYRLAVKHDPTDGNVNNNYGAYLCARGRASEAEPYFIAAVNDPFYRTPAVATANAGSCMLEAGDLDKAETFLRQSLEFDPAFAAALLPMAKVSYRRESFLTARAFLQRYEAGNQLDEEGLLLGYMIETRLGDTKAAAEYRSDLFRRYPDSAAADSLRNKQ